MFGFERNSQRLAHSTLFIKRFAISFLIGLGLIFVSLLGGMCGYHYLEGYSWVDAFLSASMILSGMGPIGEFKTDAGKLFGGIYAMYSGLAVVMVTGITFAPVVHRFLHRFHADENDTTNS